MVAARVGGVLLLGYQHADDEKRRAVDHHRLTHRLTGAEQILRELVTDEDHPPTFFDIEIVDEAPAHRRNHVAHDAVGRRDSGNGDRPLAVAVTGDQAVRVLAGDAVDELNLRLQVLDVLLHHPHPAPLTEAFEYHGGPHRPGDDDAVAEAGSTLDHLPVQTVAEGEKKAHRHRAPDDAEGREKGTQLLAPQVASQLTEKGTEAGHPVTCRSFEF